MCWRGTARRGISRRRHLPSSDESSRSEAEARPMRALRLAAWLGYLLLRRRMAMRPSRLMVIVAVVLFALAAVGVSLGGVLLVPLGLAVWAASELAP